MAARLHGHIWNPIWPKFGVYVEGAQIHIHTRLEHSRSNSNKIRQLCNFFQTLMSVTLKSRSNSKLQPLAFKWQKSDFHDGHLEVVCGWLGDKLTFWPTFCVTLTYFMFDLGRYVLGRDLGPRTYVPRSRQRTYLQVYQGHTCQGHGQGHTCQGHGQGHMSQGQGQTESRSRSHRM
jgi:hypothetical protein